MKRILMFCAALGVVVGLLTGFFDGIYIGLIAGSMAFAGAAGYDLFWLFWRWKNSENL
jgi:hypothetical protein